MAFVMGGETSQLFVRQSHLLKQRPQPVPYSQCAV